jgi:hypothetical protein
MFQEKPVTVRKCFLLLKKSLKCTEHKNIYANYGEGYKFSIENRVLRRILGPKRDEVTGGWRKLRNEEFHNLYSSHNIIRMIKSRRMRWAGHVGRMGRRVMHIGYWWESQKETDYEDQDVGG